MRFNKNWDYVENDDDCDYDDIHYYDWGFMAINPKLEIFGVDDNDKTKEK